MYSISKTFLITHTNSKLQALKKKGIFKAAIQSSQMVQQKSLMKKKFQNQENFFMDYHLIAIQRPSFHL